MKKAATILLLTLILVSCQNKTVNTKNANYKLDTTKIAILEPKKEYGSFLEDVKPTKLTSSELAIVDQILQNCISENQGNNEEHLNLLNLEEYKRQYVPFIDEDGNKSVWVNCFCDDFDYWKKSPVIVMDGGRCFFNVIVNLEDEEFSELQINGYA